MKSIDLWALVILSTMPEKHLPLEGMWRSCEKLGIDGELEVVAEFINDELIENYYGTETSHMGLGCSGTRLFHYQRKWKLKFYDFNYSTQFQESSFKYVLGKTPPNWYGCCEAYDKMSVCRIHAMAGDHHLGFKNQYTYEIKGETLKTTLKGKSRYLQRVTYPSLFKLKQSFLSFMYEFSSSQIKEKYQN